MKFTLPVAVSGYQALTALVLTLLNADATAAGFESWLQEFAASDFRFNRAASDVPFVPLAWVDVARFGRMSLSGPDGERTNAQFDETTLSEGAVVPILRGRRDAILAGQWLSYSRFDVAAPGKNFHVLSFSLPLAWVRQQSANWQLAAVAAPLGHTASHQSDYWEFMGGLFARYSHDDELAWLVGLYADVSTAEHFYTPYVGATWILNPHWTLSAVVPWPAVIYAPTANYFFRLGISPSGTAWSVDHEQQHARIDFSSWNFGLSAQWRVWKNLWLRGEGGITGVRGFSFIGSDFKGPNSDLGTAPYASFGITFRPPQGR